MLSPGATMIEYGQTFVLVVHVPTGEDYERWTADMVAESYLTAGESEPIGVAEVVDEDWPAAPSDARKKERPDA